MFPWWEEKNPQGKVLSHTRYRLFELTNIDAAYSKYYIPANIFGFRMDHPLTTLFIDKYHDLVRYGYGFISDTPEEYVHSCILSQDVFNEWEPTVSLKLLSNKRERMLTQVRRKKVKKPYLGLFKRTKKVTKPMYEEKEMHDKSEKEGYFFYYRAH